MPARRSIRPKKSGGATEPLVIAAGAVVLIAVSVIVQREMTVYPALATGATIFTSVFVQAFPFLVLGVVLSGVLAAWVSPLVIRRILPRNQTAAVCAAAVAGAALPGCECASVPVAARLIDRGVPAGAAIAFMLSAPAINPVVLTATAVAFPGRPDMVVARLIGSLLTAVVVGSVWSRWARPSWLTAIRAPTEEVNGSAFTRFVDAAAHDGVHAGSYLVVGAAATAVLHVCIPSHWFDHIGANPVLAIVAMGLLAVALAVCSEADAFVAASFTALPMTARLTFMVVGPAIDLKLGAMQIGAFGRATAARLVPLIFVVAMSSAVVTGYVVFGGTG